jgi:hypothetical protein
MSSESADRSPSEAFPAIPKIVQQRRADTKHRPFRPSPLSGKRETPAPQQLFSPLSLATSSSNNIEEDLKRFHGNEENSLSALSPSYKESSNKDVSSSSEPNSPLKGLTVTAEAKVVESKSDASKTSKSDYSSSEESRQHAEVVFSENKEIEKLKSILDAKMEELSGVEKRLLETEQNAARLLTVLRSKYEKELPGMKANLDQHKQVLFKIMDEMDSIVKITMNRRDEIIEQETDQVVERVSQETERLLQMIDEDISSKEAQESASQGGIRSLVGISMLIVAVSSVLALLLIVSFQE